MFNLININSSPLHYGKSIIETVDAFAGKFVIQSSVLGRNHLLHLPQKCCPSRTSPVPLLWVPQSEVPHAGPKLHLHARVVSGQVSNSCGDNPGWRTLFQNCGRSQGSDYCSRALNSLGLAQPQDEGPHSGLRLPYATAVVFVWETSFLVASEQNGRLQRHAG